MQITENLLAKMTATVQAHALFENDNPLLLMVSGGSDSTALARLAAMQRDAGNTGPLAMMHMNHQLRGEDANADAEFVADLAAELDIPLFVCEMNIAAEARRTGENIEAVARRERYIAANEALVSTCMHEGFPLKQGRIVTAHTADDRIENFYMRSIVGTGPGGFRSMLYRNGAVIRPLLDCTRQELRNFLMEAREAEAAGQGDAPWREDATNEHTDRFRAYVRHEIVPKARSWNANLDETLVRTMNLIADEDDMLQDMAEEAVYECTKRLGDEDADGFLLLPSFGDVRKPIARRAVHDILKKTIGLDERIDTSAVEAVLASFEDGLPISGYVTNIQGNLAVSSNKQGTRIEPMAAFRKRRKK